MSGYYISTERSPEDRLSSRIGSRKHAEARMAAMPPTYNGSPLMVREYEAGE